MLRIFIFMLVFLWSGISLTLNSQSIWETKNPTIPNNDIEDVFFLNETEGWACSDDDEIVHTSDGGVNWEVQYAFDADYYIRHLFFVNENIGFAYGRHIFKTLDGGNNWEMVFYSVLYDYIRTLFFIDENTGWFGNNSGDIYQTADGGISWQQQDHPANETWVSDIHFIDEQKGWAVLRHGSFLKTIDGGQSWELLQDEVSSLFYNKVFFINESEGWITINGNFILKTEDGGYTCDTVFIDSEEPLISTKFFDSTNGVCYSDNYSYRTADGGLSWDQLDFPLYSSVSSVNSARFPSLNFACIVHDGGIHYSTDMGVTWVQADGGFFWDLNGVFFTDDEKLFIAGANGLIKRSDDKGESWEDLVAGTDVDFYDVFFIDENHGWICGEQGSLYYTSNGGNSWELKDLNINNDINSIFFVNGQIGFFVGHNGVAYKTENGGNDWLEMEGATNEFYYDVFFIDELNGWICSKNGIIYRTTDGGENFQLQQTPGEFNINAVFFIDSMTGWAVGRHYIYYTVNGGNNWTMQYEVTSSNYLNRKLNDIWFINETHGWACGQRGLALHTVDGGQNWILQNSGYDDDLEALFCASNEEAFIVGEGGIVLYTDQASYLGPKILTQSQDTVICEAQDFELFVDVIGDGLNFQWYNTNQPLEGQTQNTLQFTSISPFEGGIFRCEVMNKGGRISSEAIHLSIKPLAQIISHPQDTFAYENNNINLIVGVSGALPVYYQWQKNGIDIPNAIHNVLPFYEVQQSDSAYYRCIVSNDCNSDTSQSAKLTVYPPSAINSQEEIFSFRVFPNPVQDFLNLQCSSPIRNVEYKIFDQLGSLKMIGEILEEDNYKINIEPLQSGIYILHLTKRGNSNVIKFIKP